MFGRKARAARLARERRMAESLARLETVAAEYRQWGDRLRFQLDGDTLVAALAKHKRDRGLQ